MMIIYTPTHICYVFGYISFYFTSCTLLDELFFFKLSQFKFYQLYLNLHNFNFISFTFLISIILNNFNLNNHCVN